MRAIADRLLERYDANAVWVKAAKPEPPLALPVTEVSVEVWREAGRLVPELGCVGLPRPGLQPRRARRASGGGGARCPRTASRSSPPRRVYETEPVGLVLDQPEFLNACLRIETELGPEALLDACKAGRAGGGASGRAVSATALG